MAQPTAAMVRLNVLLQKQAELLAKRNRLLHAHPRSAALRQLARDLNKVNLELKGVGQVVSAQAWDRFKSAATRAFATTTIAAGALGVALKQAVSHFAPGEVLRFEYAIGDLAAVVGSILLPTFQKITAWVRRFANYLLNLPPHIKDLANLFLKVLAPVTAISITLSGLTLIYGSIARAGVAAWSAITAAALRAQAAQAAAGGAGAAAGAAAGRFATAKAGLGGLLLGGAKAFLAGVAVVTADAIYSKLTGNQPYIAGLLGYQKDKNGRIVPIPQTQNSVGMDAARQVSTLSSPLEIGQRFREASLAQTPAMSAAQKQTQVLEEINALLQRELPPAAAAHIQQARNIAAQQAGR